MVRPEKFIPLEDIKGLKTLISEGKNPTEISRYYSKVLPYEIGRMSIVRKIENMRECDPE